jgi:4'-phosphopantetheinyl transferase
MSMPAGRPLTIHCTGPFPLPDAPSGDAPLGAGHVHVWTSTLGAQRTAISALHALLDEEEKARAGRFRFDHDRERFIIAHGILRTLLGRYLDTAPFEVRMGRGPYGKPFVEGTDLRFNLSDTKDAVVLALTRGQEIGADIETMARTVDHIAVSEHYFTPDEIGSIRTAGNEALEKRRFLELWTRKEAVLKASGVGIMDDLRVLRVGDPLNAMTITHEAFVRDAAAEYHVSTWHLGNDHIISLASPERIDRVVFRQAWSLTPPRPRSVGGS